MVELTRYEVGDTVYFFPPRAHLPSRTKIWKVVETAQSRIYYLDGYNDAYLSGALLATLDDALHEGMLKLALKYDEAVTSLELYCKNLLKEPIERSD